MIYKTHVGKDTNGKWSWCVLSNRIAILQSRKFSNKANAERARDEFIGRQRFAGSKIWEA